MKASTTRQACAFGNGYKAAKAGKLASVNPHRKGTVDHDWWVKGYEAPPCGTCGDQGEVLVSKGAGHHGMETEPDPVYAACPDCG